MFERRLKTMGFILIAMSVVLLGRLIQVQVFGRTTYVDLAQQAMTLQRLIPTTRGTIVDIRGRPIAVDEACIDAAVDFRAVTRDRSQKLVKDWVSKLAVQRLRSRNDGVYSAADAVSRRKLRDREEQAVFKDIDAMWADLAEAGRVSIDEIEDTRTRIEAEVVLKRRRIGHNRYLSAVDEVNTREKPAWYTRLLAGGNEQVPTEDEFDDDLIYEQQAPHVIIRALSTDAQNVLGSNMDRYPGLVLQPSKHRAYPFNNQAAHVIGYVSHVQPTQVENDPDADNDLREYKANDLAGRDGIEALAERMLRGTRGSESQVGGDWGTSSRVDPIPGQTVTCTLDMDLQQQIRDLFTRVEVSPPGDTNHVQKQYVAMHGSAVVIDLASGELRALVSYPDYNLNTYTTDYRALREDEGNNPLFHRAVRSQYEPGSTVKPLVGLSAVAQGVTSLDERIECTGYLFIRGKRQTSNRCWTATIDPNIVYVHHNIPGNDPHPTGFLNYHDAIQRSCNVYFENMADRLGTEGLSSWMERFGLGQYTGLGIQEDPGRLPRSYRGPQIVSATWSGGIGQTCVLATPLQVANVTATIARGGVWVRPKLLRDAGGLTPWQSNRTSVGPAYVGQDRVDLKLSSESIAVAKQGMMDVVMTAAGSGTVLQRAHVSVAAKTGTAQAAEFHYWETGEDGKRVRMTPTPGTWNNPNPQFPWYRASDSAGKKLHHAWITGFAPAENPKIAFAVLVEYAGAGGGAVAGPVATKLLDACVEHGYVPKTK